MFRSEGMWARVHRQATVPMCGLFSNTYKVPMMGQALQRAGVGLDLSLYDQLS